MENGNGLLSLRGLPNASPLSHGLFQGASEMTTFLFRVAVKSNLLVFRYCTLFDRPLILLLVLKILSRLARPRCHPPTMKFTAALVSLLATSASAFQPVAPAPRNFQALQMSTKMSQDELKKQVGYKAVDDYVKSGMVVGLGTGSTAYYAVERVGEKLKSGELKDIIAIPTSIRTKEQAEELGIPLVTLDTHSKLDVAIDGADEVDPELNLTKGGGGALFREKIVEIVSDKFIVIVDESKLCDGLGPGFPVPVEIVPFCHEHTMRVIGDLPSCKGSKPVLRMGSAANNQVDGDEIAVTDNGNYIVDLHFEEPIKDPKTMAVELKNVCGVVEHGLFCDMATAVIIAGSDGISVKEA